jgi:GntR family transcriptional regulator
MNTLAEPELTITGGAPIHGQLRDQLRACILEGRLQPGEQLPTPRAVAVGLAINPQAVDRAYRQLERLGFLTSEDGSGTFVAPRPDLTRARVERDLRLEHFCARWLASASRHGYVAEEVLRTMQTLVG